MSKENKYTQNTFIDETAMNIFKEIKSQQSDEVLSTIEAEYKNPDNDLNKIHHLIEDAILKNKQLYDDYNGIYKEGEDNMSNFHEYFKHLINPEPGQEGEEGEEEKEEEDDNFSIEISSTQSAEPNIQDDETPNQPDDHSVNETFEEKMKKQINSVATQLSISHNLAYLLLKKLKWDENRVLYRWREKKELILNLLSELHVSEIDIKNELTLESVGKGTCPICLADDVEMSKLYCGHCMCNECWKSEIREQLTDIKVKISPIYCRYDNCGAEIMHSDVESLLGPEAAKDYKDSLVEARASFDKRLVKCPRPNCPEYISIDTLGAGGIVTCSCGTKVCWHCGKKAHSPLECGRTNVWGNYFKRMKATIREQKKWEEREIDCYEYRINHVEEVSQARERLIEQIERENNELDQRENDEIESLRKKMSEVDDKDFKKFIEFTINQKIKDYGLKKDERLNHLKAINNELVSYETHLRNKVLMLRDMNDHEVFYTAAAIEQYRKLKEEERRKERQREEERQRLLRRDDDDDDDDDGGKVFEKSEDYIAERTKPCPNCKSPIVKNGGCNHMKCTRCNHSFCWVCGSDWSAKHYNCIKKKEVSDNRSTNQSNSSANNNNSNDNNNNNNSNDMSYRLPPMNCVIKREYNERNRLYNNYKKLNDDDKWEVENSQYHRNKAQQRYENRIDTQGVQKKFIDIIRSYDNARNVLIHSYQAAFLMEKNTSASFIFNQILEPLETIYYQFKKALYSGTDEEFAQIAKTADRIDQLVNEILSGFDL